MTGYLSLSRENVLKRMQQECKKLSGRVLDIGAGNTPYRECTKANKYIALDISPGENIDIVADACFLPFKGNVFDNSICMEVIHHVKYPRELVKEIHRCLKPGGKLLLSTRYMYPMTLNIHDYFRFTEEALRDMFKEFKEIKITYEGGFFYLLAEMVRRGLYKKHINFLGTLLVPLLLWFDKIFFSKRWTTGYFIEVHK